MAFFEKEFIKFLKDLSKNNTREWFHENKTRYDKLVKAPFHAFVDHMIYRMHQEYDPSILMLPKEAIFRIHRDVRFSKDKTPYKSQMSAVISPGGKKDYRLPGLYFQVSDKDVRIYSGVHSPEKEDLQLIREHISQNLEEFNELMSESSFQTYFKGQIHGEKNKRLPKEFQEIAKVQALIANKAFYYFASLPTSIVLQDDIDQIVMDHMEAARNMNDFLGKALFS